MDPCFLLPLLNQEFPFGLVFLGVQGILAVLESLCFLFDLESQVVLYCLVVLEVLGTLEDLGGPVSQESP